MTKLWEVDHEQGGIEVLRTADGESHLVERVGAETFKAFWEVEADWRRRDPWNSAFWAMVCTMGALGITYVLTGFDHYLRTRMSVELAFSIWAIALCSLSLLAARGGYLWAQHKNKEDDRLQDECKMEILKEAGVQIGELGPEDIATPDYASRKTKYVLLPPEIWDSVKYDQLF